jgi:GNAT superfamily N-acetyltransferase
MIRDINPDGSDIGFFKKFERETEFVKVVPEIAHKTYSDLIARGVGKVFILCDDNTGEIMGGMGMLKAPDLHDGVVTAIETFFFVDRSCESPWGAFTILRAFDKWAKENGCKRKALIHLADSSPGRLGDLYEHMGYHLAEYHWIKEV